MKPCSKEEKKYAKENSGPKPDRVEKPSKKPTTKKGYS